MSSNLYILGGLTGALGKGLWARFQESTAVGRRNVDISDESNVRAWTGELVDDEGPIHVINVTGVSLSSMLHKQDVSDWVRMLHLNVIGSALLLKHLRPVFKTHPGSTMTLVGSVTVRTAPAGTAMYTASKAAMEGLVRVAAREFSPFARVNLIELGYCDVGMIGQVDTSRLIPMIPLGRLGTAADLAEAWRFCMGCQYVTGAVVPVNGGLA